MREELATFWEQVLGPAFDRLHGGAACPSSHEGSDWDSESLRSEGSDQRGIDRVSFLSLPDATSQSEASGDAGDQCPGQEARDEPPERSITRSPSPEATSQTAPKDRSATLRRARMRAATRSPSRHSARASSRSGRARRSAAPRAASKERAGSADAVEVPVEATIRASTNSAVPPPTADEKPKTPREPLPRLWLAAQRARSQQLNIDTCAPDSKVADRRNGELPPRGASPSLGGSFSSGKPRRPSGLLTLAFHQKVPSEMGWNTVGSPTDSAAVSEGKRRKRRTQNTRVKRRMAHKEGVGRAAGVGASVGWIDSVDRVEELEAIASQPSSRIHWLIQSEMWQFIVGAVVILSCLTAGLEVQVSSQMGVNDQLPFLLMECVFVTFFAFDIVVRMWVFRGGFFITGKNLHSDIQWRNLFDLALLVINLVDVLLNLIVGMIENARMQMALQSLSFLRLMRLLRLVRLLPPGSAFVQVLRAIADAFKKLWCVLALLGLLIYALSVFFVQLAASRLEDIEDPELILYFSSLWRCGLWLFAAVFGGCDWMNVAMSLWRTGSDSENVVSTLLFVSYILCSVIAICNLAAGVFIESALSAVAQGRKEFVRSSVRELFKCISEDGGDISFHDFHRRLSDPRVLRLFEALEVQASEAGRLFELLDYDRSGTVSLQEFASGCVRLQGPAKSMDLAALMYAVQHLQHDLQSYQTTVSNGLRLRSQTNSRRPVYDSSGSGHRPSLI